MSRIGLGNVAGPHRQPMTRRGVLGAGLGAAAFPALGHEDALSQPLRILAGRGGRLYGAAIEPENIDGDPAFSALVGRHCAVLVPENVMKWNALHPQADVYDFARADRFMAIAQDMLIAQDMVIAQDKRASVHGHCLVWHEAAPDWLRTGLTPGAARALLTGHIQTVVQRYAGRIRSWDVVNEAVERNDRRADGLRASFWLRALGPSYLNLAFETARAVDPGARLALADYGLEYDDERWMVEKRGTMLGLLERLRADGAPVHALAIQGHLDGARPPAFGDGLRRFLADVAALGFDIYVTELDVNDQTLAGDPARRDAVVGACYRAFLEVVCDEPAVKMINTWGLSDRYTSKRTMFPRDDGQSVRPLPFDADLKPKAAAAAMAQVFASRSAKR